MSFLLQAAPGSSLTSGSSNDEELLPLSSDFSLLSGNDYESDLLDIWSADSMNDGTSFVSSSSFSSSSSSSNNVFDFLDDPNQLISSDSNFLDPISSPINNDDESTFVANTFVGSNDDNNDVSCTSSSKVKRNNEQSSCVSPPDDNDVIDLHLPNLPQVFGSGGQYDSGASDFSQEGAASINFPKFCRLIGFPLGVCCEGPVSELFTLTDFLIYDRIKNCVIGMCLIFLLDFYQYHRVLCIIIQ